MKKEATTYEELLRQKRCVDLTKYYELSEEEVETIYNFLLSNPTGELICSKDNISLVSDKIIGHIQAKCISSSIDGLRVGNTHFDIIPHYEYTSSHSSHSGSSSNNNNNNNYNNNNNNNR